MLSIYVIIVERTCTSESMNPRPCFLALQYYLCSLLSLVTLLFLYFQITKTYIYYPYCACITISSPNQCTYTIYHCIGCVGDTRDSFIWFQGCLRESFFILRHPWIDKPQVNHLRVIFCCPTKLCTWRRNNVYKNRSCIVHIKLFSSAVAREVSA